MAVKPTAPRVLWQCCEHFAPEAVGGTGSAGGLLVFFFFLGGGMGLEDVGRFVSLGGSNMFCFVVSSGF